MKWTRRFPNSLNNFDLMLTDPGELDSVRMNALLDRILAETRRGLSLGSRASTEFRRFFAQPDTFLKSEANLDEGRTQHPHRQGDYHC